MTQDDSAPQDRPTRADGPVTGDITGSPGEPGETGETGETGAAEPTVTPDQDDPDREGEDRFDAG